VAGKAGRAYRDIRAMVANARSDLREQIGPEIDGLGLRDIDPRQMLGRSIFGDDDGRDNDADEAAGAVSAAGPVSAAGAGDASPGEQVVAADRPRFDPDTT
jgi:hypothetical protein